MILCHMGKTTYAKFFGGLHPEIWEGQKVKNLTRYWTTFEFDREYLKNRSRYQKSETNLIDNDPRWVQQKKSVNLSPLTKKLQTRVLTHPKLTIRLSHMVMH